MSDVVIGLLLGPLILVALYVAARIFPGAQRRAEQRYLQRLIAEGNRRRSGAPVDAERAFLKRCTHCRVFAVTLPHRDKLGRTYCSDACMQWWGDGPRSFCEKCSFETDPQASATLYSFHLVGTTFVGKTAPCGDCRSVVRRVWLTVFYLPVVPLRRYRVIQVSPEAFLSRRLSGAAIG